MIAERPPLSGTVSLIESVAALQHTVERWPRRLRCTFRRREECKSLQGMRIHQAALVEIEGRGMAPSLRGLPPGWNTSPLTKKAVSMSRIRLAAIALALLWAPAVQAQYTVNFNSDPLSSPANGWQSSQSTIVSFAATGGGSLQVGSWNESNFSNALGAFGDVGNIGIEMSFSQYMTMLAFDFGNDDPGWISAAGWATLTLFNNATQINFFQMHPNADDLMNQRLTYNGPAFNRAIFQYAPDLQPTGLIEIIDNVQFSAVPEPASMTLLATGLAGIVGAGLRRRKMVS